MGERRQIPSCLDELTPEQYERYLFLCYHLMIGGLEPDMFRRKWLTCLLGLPADIELYSVSESERGSLMESMEGFFVRSGNDGEDVVSPDFDCERNLLPEYGGFRGPGDWLEGMTFGEFTGCLNILESISDGEDDEIMEGYASMTRVMYHMPSEAEVPPLLLMHAPRYFCGIWRRICSEPISLNGREIDFRIIFRGDSHRKADDRTGWAGLTFEVASAGLFGKVPEVEQTGFWDVLLYLYRCKFEYLEEKKKSLKNKK